jgi:hypothetical protein
MNQTDAKFIVSKTGSENLLTIDALTKIVTCDKLVANSMVISTDANPLYGLDIFGGLNVTKYYNGITFNKNPEIFLGGTPENDFQINIPIDSKFTVSHTGSVDILTIDATSKSVGIAKSASDGFMLDVDGNIRGSIIDSAQLITNSIYSKQGGFIAGILEVDDLLAKNTIKSNITGSVSAFSISFNTPCDLVRGNIRGVPGEPGSRL